ncbi:MAG: Ig-like domain-containing protein [Myxococcota bacterium]
MFGIATGRAGCAIAFVATSLISTAAVAAPTDFAPQRGTYIRVDPPNILAPGTGPLEGGASHVLYLNRCAGGLSLTPGNTDSSSANVSQILEGAVTLPAFSHGDAAWAEVLSITKSLFAPFNITVTDVDPGATPHDEAIVCGTSADAGFDGDFWGVAPFGCGIIPTAVTFTFPASIGNAPRDIAETIAQEAAHAWGLDHSFKCEDPMTYLFDCGAKSFQEGDFPCGEYEARVCDCGGNTQNTVEHILAAFGPGVPDTAAPVVSIVHPLHGDRFAQGEVFDVELMVADGGSISSVSLFLDGELQATDEDAPYGGWPVIDLPVGVYEMYAEANDVAGNIGESQVITVEVVGQDGPEGEGEDDGAADGDGDGGADGADPDADPEDDGGAAADDEGPIPLPPGWGSTPRQDSSGCATGPDGRSAPVWALVLLTLAAVGRRRSVTARGR